MDFNDEGERLKAKGQKRRSWEDVKLKRRIADANADWVESVSLDIDVRRIIIGHRPTQINTDKIKIYAFVFPAGG